MTNMKEVAKRTKLQKILLSTSLVHMENRWKEENDVYFGMLGYDISLYTKHVEEVVKPVRRQQRTTDSTDNVQADWSL